MYESGVGGNTAAVGQVADPLEDVGRVLAPAEAQLVGFPDGRLDDGLHVASRDRVFFRDRVRKEQARLELQTLLGQDDGGGLLLGAHDGRAGHAALAGPKGREVGGGGVLGREGGDQHALGLEVLERAGHVEEALAAAADDGDAGAAQLGQVGRDIQRGGGAAVDAAEAAGAEHADAGAAGQEHGGGDGGGAVGAAADDEGEVAARDLGGALVHHPLDLGPGQADGGLAGQDAADGGDGPVGAHEVLERRAELAQRAVRVEGRLERHHRPVAGDGVGDLVRDTQQSPAQAQPCCRRRRPRPRHGSHFRMFGPIMSEAVVTRYG